MQAILEGDVELPAAIVQTIKKAVGADKHALDAMLIVGLLQALQGDEKWGKLLLERGYGKVPDKIVGDPANPIAMQISWKESSEE